MNNTNRVNNSIKYTSANYTGLTFGGLYSLGGVAGETGRNQIWSLGAGYSNGPLVLGAAYLNIRDPTIASSATTRRLHAVRCHVAGYLGLHFGQHVPGDRCRRRVHVRRCNDRRNVFEHQVQEPGAAAASPFAGQTATFHNAEINFKYQLTPALLVGAAYDYTQGSEINDNSRAQVPPGFAGHRLFPVEAHGLLCDRRLSARFGRHVGDERRDGYPCCRIHQQSDAFGEPESADGSRRYSHKF